MKNLKIMLMFLLMVTLFPVLSFADTIDCSNSTIICLKQELNSEEIEKNRDYFKDRFSSYKKDVNQEIKRNHEIELEAKKIEVLGRLEMLKSNNINVYNSSYSNTQAVANTGSIRKISNNT